MKIIYLVPFLLAACSSPEDKALRSGQFAMHPTNSPSVSYPAVAARPANAPSDGARIEPNQPERSEALTKDGYSDTAPGNQPAGAPEDLHDVVGTKMQSDRGRLHTMGAAPGVNNPSTSTDHNVDINQERDRSRAGD